MKLEHLCTNLWFCQWLRLQYLIINTLANKARDLIVIKQQQHDLFCVDDDDLQVSVWFLHVNIYFLHYLCQVGGVAQW